jgi:uncharacterized protein YkwD
MRLFSLFFPNRNHKKRSNLLWYQSLFGYAFFISALIFSTFLINSGAANVLGYATDISISDLLEYTNELREEKGLRDLVLNANLSKAAEAKANHMFENDYWAHTSPDGKEPWDFIVASGYDYQYAGENLAVDFGHSKSVVSAWDSSPTHQRNLLNKNYSDIGFAVVNGELNGRETTLVVQMFGTPRNVMGETASAEISNEADNLNILQINNETELAETAPETAEEKLEVPLIPNTKPFSAGTVLNASSVFNTSKYLAVIFGLFLTLLFAFDGLYVRRMGILRVTGHTILHMLILILAIVGIWYTSIGLVL